MLTFSLLHLEKKELTCQFLFRLLKLFLKNVMQRGIHPVLYDLNINIIPYEKNKKMLFSKYLNKMLSIISFVYAFVQPYKQWNCCIFMSVD